jgi:hypothetical protein
VTLPRPGADGRLAVGRVKAASYCFPPSDSRKDERHETHTLNHLPLTPQSTSLSHPTSLRLSTGTVSSKPGREVPY